MDNMKLFLKKLYRYFAGPQIGDLYYREARYANPFKNGSETDVVVVIDKKDNWIQFQCELHNGEPCAKTQWEYSEHEFKSCYTFIGTKLD